MQKTLIAGLVALLPAFAQVKITPGTNQIAVEIDGKPYTTFFYGPSNRNPTSTRSVPNRVRSSRGAFRWKRYPAN